CEGRSRSLGASLAYGFEQAFSEKERKRLALLHLFQGFVYVGVLVFMGDPESSWCLPEVQGLSREEGKALLDRAAEVGLLSAYGGGCYGIHPALPWFLKGLFDRCHPADDLAVVHAFVESMGVLGNYYCKQYTDGNRDVLAALRTEEANLLHARRLARAHGWWDPVTSTMQGLRQLYDHTGRRAEWKRLVEEIVPDFVDPENDSPLPGREEDWSLVTEYRVRLAREERQWDEAERLQTAHVDWDRQHATPALARPTDELESGERNAIRTLAASLGLLGYIRREVGSANCIPAYEESLELNERIGDRSGAAICAFNLGHAFKNLPTLRDLNQAEHWYRRSLDLYDERERHDRGQCLGQLGNVAWQRFHEALKVGRPEEELLQHLNEAVKRYHE
ncbi:MAG: tetratricopeptide repeat protein, partial [bacterium]